MSIWDAIKGLFGGKPHRAMAPATAAQLARVEAAVQARVRARQLFRQLDIAKDTSSSVEEIQASIQALEELFQRGIFGPLGYTRTHKPHAFGEWVYHPVDVDAPAIREDVALAASLASMPPHQVGPPVQSPSAGHTPADFENPAILGLSEKERQARALKLSPSRVAQMGRIASILPATDERAAVIDRSLVLRGLLSEEQVAEIHQVGDEWIKHHDALSIAGAATAKNFKAAVDQLQAERARLKAEKKRLAAERAAKHVEDVARRRAEDIIHLGPAVSFGLADRRSNVEALQKLGLPVLATPADVARWLSLPVKKLRWLCFHSEAATRTHYVFFEVKKRSGGMRLLSAPHATLAKAQAQVLRTILDKLPTEEPAHGFIKGRSTVTNATPHLKRDLVVNLDLKDFFPSVTFPRVRGVFKKLGYSPAVATVLALLCTESPRRKVEYDGQALWVAVGPRALPQGACTSPALSNQVAKRLDRRLKAMATKSGWSYTRYADDLTFSAPKSNEAGVAMLLARVRHVVVDEDFTLQEKKGRVQRASGRQTVTGIVVNVQKPGLPREQVRELRAILHNARKTSLAAQNREARPHFEAWLRGRIAYLTMVDRAKGSAMLKQLDALLQAGKFGPNL